MILFVFEFILFESKFECGYEFALFVFEIEFRVVLDLNLINLISLSLSTSAKQSARQILACGSWAKFLASYEQPGEQS